MIIGTHVTNSLIVATNNVSRMKERQTKKMSNPSFTNLESIYCIAIAILNARQL